MGNGYISIMMSVLSITVARENFLIVENTISIVHLMMVVDMFYNHQVHIISKKIVYAMQATICRSLSVAGT